MVERSDPPANPAEKAEQSPSNVIPAFLNGRRPRDAGEPAPNLGDMPSEEGAEGFMDETPPYKAGDEQNREAERELERAASGHAADEVLGFTELPLVVGDPARVRFGTKRSQSEKSGTLLALDDPQSARIRLNGSKDPMGEVFPVSRVATEPVNGGKPLTGKVAQREAGKHAQHMTEYREAKAGNPPKGARPSDGFAHAHAAADEEVAPLPKRTLRKGDNGGLSELTILRHLGVIRAAKEAVNSATGKLREKLKKAKDDGVDTKVLKKLLDELKMAPEELTDNLNRENDYRRAVHLPAAGFIHTFGEEDRDTPEKRRAHATETGYQAGYRGADMSSNPYPDENDPCHQAWNDAWKEAQGHLLGKGIKELKAS